MLFPLLLRRVDDLQILLASGHPVIVLLKADVSVSDALFPRQTAAPRSSSSQNLSQVMVHVFGAVLFQLRSSRNANIDLEKLEKE
jgi:hypothetical protein